MLRRVSIGFVLVSVLMACQTVPLTGRSQLILISREDELALGAQTYQKTLGEAALCANPDTVQLVRETGQRLASVSGQPEYGWEFNVIKDDDMVNAFALPGGKVAVYSGLLAIVQSEAELAVVLAHEIGHAIARHGAERLSTQQLVQLGEIALIAALGINDPQAVQAVDTAYGIGMGVGLLLPYSRRHESEADRIGLILMAKAGYPPEAAVTFWQRMLEHKQGKDKVPEFLSTHPSDARRIRQIEEWIPGVQDQYDPPGLDQTDGVRADRSNLTCP